MSSEAPAVPEARAAALAEGARTGMERLELRIVQTQPRAQLRQVLRHAATRDRLSGRQVSEQRGVDEIGPPLVALPPVQLPRQEAPDRQDERVERGVEQQVADCERQPDADQPQRARREAPQ